MVREEGFLNKRKLERLYAEYSQDDVIDRQKYNTILGAVVAYGLIVNIILCVLFPNIYEIIPPLIFFIGYFVCVILGTVMSAKSTSPIVSFVGYNLVVVPCGLTISTAVRFYGGLSSEVVSQAFTYTLCITAIMIAGAILKPELFESLGKYLFFGLIAVMIGSVVGIFISGLYSIVSIIGAVVFSLYIGYDFYKAQQYTPTTDNAVDCALDIYLDIINLFITLLRIFGGKSRSND